MTACEEPADLIAKVAKDAPTDQAKLIAAIEAVAALHRPRTRSFHSTEDSVPHTIDFCRHDGELYPCPTVAAITRPLGKP